MVSVASIVGPQIDVRLVRLELFAIIVAANNTLNELAFSIAGICSRRRISCLTNSFVFARFGTSHALRVTICRGP